uniref:Transmembrane protein 14A n=1 Tax=Sciurus vulgaris TaxID=55149 RepID=A0A8D2B4N0_SCIVU
RGREGGARKEQLWLGVKAARRVGRCWRRGCFRIPGGVPSLIAGLFVGFLAGYGAYRVSMDKRDVKLSLFTAFFLATIMGVRFKRSKKVMPAGLVAGLSLMMILRLVLLLL